MTNGSRRPEALISCASLLRTVTPHELEARIHDAPLHRAARQTLADHLAGTLADEVARDTQRRERRRDLCGDREIVEARERNAFGNREAPALGIV